VLGATRQVLKDLVQGTRLKDELGHPVSFLANQHTPRQNLMFPSQKQGKNAGYSVKNDEKVLTLLP
jgi:hypothetical protein